MDIFKIFRKQADASISNSMGYITHMKTGWQWGNALSFEPMLTHADKEKAYYGNPILYKGINKKARDTIYDWFKIDSPLDDIDVPEAIETKIYDFLTDKQIQRKLYRCLKDVLVQGNSWFEWNCAGSKEPGIPLNGKLNDIRRIDPSLIVGYKLNEDKTDIEYWIYKNGKEKIPIHASRLEHISFNPKGDSPFGISPIEVAHAVIKADNDTTEALGNNLSLFGHPFPTINTTDNQNKKQVDDAFKVLGALKKKQLKVGFAGFKDTKFNLLNPSSPNPQYSLNHFYIEFAAALEMPMMLLIGSNMSKLTGSEIELNDYYKSINATQNIFISPIIHKMFRLLLGDAWKYEIYWNPLFVDEKSEADIKTKWMHEINESYGKWGTIDIVEARQLLREHDVSIPEGNELDEPEEPVTPMEPEIEPKIVNRQLNQYEMDLRNKVRKLGEKELKEQEKRLKK